MQFFAGPRSSKSSIFLIFWKAFKTQGKHHYLTSGQLKCKNSLIWRQNRLKTEISKNCNFFAGPRSSKSSIFLIFWKAFKTQGKHHYLTSGQLKCKNSLIWRQNRLKTEISKNCNSQVSQVRGHRNLQSSIFLIFWKAFKTQGKHHYLTSGQLKCKNSLIWRQNRLKTEISKNCNFFAGPRSSRSSIFLIFWKAFKTQGTHHYLTSGQLKCKNSLIWRQNRLKTEISKNCNFFAGPRSSKSSIFLIFWKAFRTQGKHHYLTSGQLKCKNSLIWRQNRLKTEISKNCNFFAGPRSSKSSIFLIFWKAFKTQGKHHYLTSGQLKCKNSLIWRQNRLKTEISKNCNFFAGPRSSKSSIFLIFWKAFKTQGKHHYLTSGQLKCKNSLIWRQNRLKTEISKNCNFSQVRGHRNLQFF